MEGSLVTEDMHSYIIVISWSWIWLSPGEIRTLFCVTRTTIFPVPLLALFLFISSWLRRHLVTACALSYVLVTGDMMQWIHCSCLQKDKVNNQGLTARLCFVGCLVCLVFSSSSPTLLFILLILLFLFFSFKKHMCTRAWPPHTHTHIWKSEDKLCYRFWLLLCLRQHLLLFTCVFSKLTGRRGSRDSPVSASHWDVHYGIELSADSGEFSSGGHICMLCALPTGSFPHHCSSFCQDHLKSRFSLFSPFCQYWGLILGAHTCGAGAVPRSYSYSPPDCLFLMASLWP